MTESFLGGIRGTLAGALDRDFGEYLNATQYANDGFGTRLDPSLVFLNGTSAQAGHLGIGVSLIDDNQPFRNEVEAAVEPSLPLGMDVRTQQFGSMGRLY